MYICIIHMYICVNKISFALKLKKKHQINMIKRKTYYTNMEAKHARKKAIYVTRCKYIYTLNIAWTNIMCCKRDSQREGEREKKWSNMKELVHV